MNKGDVIVSENVLTALAIIISFLLIAIVFRAFVSTESKDVYRETLNSVARDIAISIDRVAALTGSGMTQIDIPKGLYMNLKIDYKSVFITSGDYNVKNSFSGLLKTGPYEFSNATVLCISKTKYDNKVFVRNKICSCDSTDKTCDPECAVQGICDPECYSNLSDNVCNTFCIKDNDGICDPDCEELSDNICDTDCTKDQDCGG